MYTAIIVDDERMIRNGIRASIPWAKIGISEVLTASSGVEAIPMIASQNVDIMLTDICMTEMNGLALIEQINKTNPNIRIIVLTGYDNFEYVQKCCKMQVQDFILKPADEDELTHAIKKQVLELDKKRNMWKYQKIMSRSKGISEEIRLELSMRRLVHRKVTMTEMGEVVTEYNYNINQPMQVVIVTPQLDTYDGAKKGWEGHDDLLMLSIKNLCMECFDSRYEGITFTDEDNTLLIAAFVDSDFDEVVERVERLNNMIKDEFDFTAKVCIGNSVNGFEELSDSYDDATALINNVNSTLNDIVGTDNSRRRMKIFGETFDEFKRAISSNTGDVDKVLRAFTAFECSVHSYNLSNSLVSRCCFEIASSLYFTYLSDTGESVDNKLNSLLNSLLVCNREESARFTREFITQLFRADEENTHEIINKAKRYISDNLQQELTVSNIAEQLYITPNYFSRLFKKVSGEGCNEYIVRKRIDKAKSLLESTSIKSGKIAQMVGYRDTNYFSLAFKKHTGQSPTGYREIVQRN